ncbi:MAG: DUF58 domain-containing protein [Porticoccaceae bacterium]
MAQRMGTLFRSRLDRWFKKRLPPANLIQLSSRRLFIFPTRAGFVWLGLLLLSWLVATNYENNVVFGFTCLLTALFIVGILATYANLSGVSIRYIHAAPVFAGEIALIEVAISQPVRRERTALRLYFSEDEAVAVSLHGLESLSVKIPVATTHRGWFAPGWLTIESVYPLGLLRVWSRLDLNGRCLTYPRPVSGNPIQTLISGAGGDQICTDEGSEDFVGLNNYQPGDSLKRVAWKQFARGQGMHIKYYADFQSEELWLDWESFSGCDRESRLSRLCGQVLRIENSNQTDICYGLRLPGLEIAPACGETHRQQVLRSLALFELSHDREGQGQNALQGRQ